ncbi:MAG: DUF4352 domain-containing protein [Cytophagaceae bacterium]
MKLFNNVNSLVAVTLITTSLISCGGKKDDSGNAGTTEQTAASSDHKPEVSKPNTKAQVLYFDAKAEINVNSVTLDYFPTGEVLRDPKKEGKQFLRVEVAITNNGKDPLTPSYTSFKVNTAKEKGVGMTMLVNDGNSTDGYKDKELKAGETNTGALYFEVDGKETPATMTLVYDGGYVDGKTQILEIPLK